MLAQKRMIPLSKGWKKQRILPTICFTLPTTGRPRFTGLNQREHFLYVIKKICFKQYFENYFVRLHDVVSVLFTVYAHAQHSYSVNIT